MKRIVLALSLLTTPALAAELPTLILPTPVVSAIAQYLAQRPYAEVAQIIGALQQCVAVQTPNAQGSVVSHGECPAVTVALHPSKPADEPIGPSANPAAQSAVPK